MNYSPPFGFVSPRTHWSSQSHFPNLSQTSSARSTRSRLRRWRFPFLTSFPLIGLPGLSPALSFAIIKQLRAESPESEAAPPFEVLEVPEEVHLAQAQAPHPLPAEAWAEAAVGDQQS